MDLIGMEKVHASPQQGVVSAFTFGEWFGALSQAVRQTEAKSMLIKPSEWQAALGIQSRGDKRVLTEQAKSMFPVLFSQKMFDRDSADAVLIAVYTYNFLRYNPPQE